MSGSPSARLQLSDVRDGAAVLAVGYSDPAQLPTWTVQGLHGIATTPIPIATHRLELVNSGMKSPAANVDDRSADDPDNAESKMNELDTSEIEVGFALSADLNVICVQRSGPPCDIVALKTATAGAMSPEGKLCWPNPACLMRFLAVCSWFSFWSGALSY